MALLLFRANHARSARCQSALGGAATRRPAFLALCERSARPVYSLPHTRPLSPSGEALTLADIEAMDGMIQQTALEGTTGEVEVSQV